MQHNRHVDRHVEYRFSERYQWLHLHLLYIVRQMIDLSISSTHLQHVLFLLRHRHPILHFFEPINNKFMPIFLSTKMRRPSKVYCMYQWLYSYALQYEPNIDMQHLCILYMGRLSLSSRQFVGQFDHSPMDFDLNHFLLRDTCNNRSIATPSGICMPR